MRIVITLVVVCFCALCGWMVVESGVFSNPRGAVGPCILLSQTGNDANDAPSIGSRAEPTAKLESGGSLAFTAESSAASSISVGSSQAGSGYEFELELTSQGAGIRKATFSGFNDRDPKDPKPLVVMSPIVQRDGREFPAMANTSFVFVDHGLKLDLGGRLHWRSLGLETDQEGRQKVGFEALIKVEDTNEPAVRLTKTYTIRRDSYLIDCDLKVENLRGAAEKVRLNLSGPGGLGREAFRTDMRRVVAGFRNARGEIDSMRLDTKKLLKAKSVADRRLVKTGTNFLWAAAVNKYFAAILVPLPDEGKDYCDWVTDRIGRFYNPDGDSRNDSGDETVGVDFNIASQTLQGSGQAGSSRTYRFQLYLGPKDKSLFDKNEQYRNLGFVQTIDFMACCCPSSIIQPLAFGILALMKWMYGFWPHNYGVVIIVLVFLVRLVMHPITKKSQVSMSKFQKVLSDPEVQEIKKKYAKKPMEMQKHLSDFQRERGVSPASGLTSMLPMMVQMPIWIALWSAVYASIDLRGAPFLPFWITDLSMPDALFRFQAFTLPLFGKLDSFNLLPILMGVAFFLQQRLMPSQAAANPQAAQQQKMMMIMMPLLFPLMLYKAPSGVNLYIMASTFAGVIEQWVIRKHIREKEEIESLGVVATTKKSGGKVKKKKPKPFRRM